MKNTADDDITAVVGCLVQAVECLKTCVKKGKRSVLTRTQYSHVTLLTEFRVCPKVWQNDLRSGEDTYYTTRPARFFFSEFPKRFPTIRTWRKSSRSGPRSPNLEDFLYALHTFMHALKVLSRRPAGAVFWRTVRHPPYTLRHGTVVS